MTETAPAFFAAPGTLGAAPTGTRRRSFLLPLIVAGAVLGTGSVVSVEDAQALQHRALDTGTHPARLLAEATGGTAEPDLATAVRELQRRSGLTWGELADALGVSRRAVHHWSSGRRMSARHAQRLQALASLVAEHERSTPALTRGRLLAPGAEGHSPLAIFQDGSQPRRRVPLAVVPLASFVEEDEPLAAPPLPDPTTSPATGTSDGRRRRLGGSPSEGHA